MPASSTSNTNKARQLNHLHAQLAQLTAHMSDLENLLRMTAVQAEGMRGLGGYAGGMFMAASKVLGEETVGGQHGDPARRTEMEAVQTSLQISSTSAIELFTGNGACFVLVDILITKRDRLVLEKFETTTWKDRFGRELHQETGECGTQIAERNCVMQHENGL
ncbi:hypothetical protein D0866_02393 [Hortaea werneckii]|uniref:Uncharacterized protein n=1 Tax=Hortaea werneckii TaxID=91943 RepID=A0A3M7BFY0_HORWE|nr:hypothetical protein D0866_02393 [Hortaea werneckii]